VLDLLKPVFQLYEDLQELFGEGVVQSTLSSEDAAVRLTESELLRMVADHTIARTSGLRRRFFPSDGARWEDTFPDRTVFMGRLIAETVEKPARRKVATHVGTLRQVTRFGKEYMKVREYYDQITLAWQTWRSVAEMGETYPPAPRDKLRLFHDGLHPELSEQMEGEMPEPGPVLCADPDEYVRELAELAARKESLLLGMKSSAIAELARTRKDGVSKQTQTTLAVIFGAEKELEGAEDTVPPPPPEDPPPDGVEGMCRLLAALGEGRRMPQGYTGCHHCGSLDHFLSECIKPGAKEALQQRREELRRLRQRNMGKAVALEGQLAMLEQQFCIDQQLNPSQELPTEEGEDFPRGDAPGGGAHPRD
jgi:hypothetical protein